MRSITTMGAHRRPVTVQSLTDKLTKFELTLKNVTDRYPSSSLIHEILTKLQEELKTLD